jgi:hypothetical protein
VVLTGCYNAPSSSKPAPAQTKKTPATDTTPPVLHESVAPNAALVPVPPAFKVSDLSVSPTSIDTPAPAEVRRFVYSNGDVFHTSFFGNRTLVGFGLNEKNKDDRALGENILALYQNEGANVLENLKAAYLQMDHTWANWEAQLTGSSGNQARLQYVLQALSDHATAHETTIDKLTSSEIHDAIWNASPDPLKKTARVSD